MLEDKAKKCKGINKAHGFNGCGKLTLFRKNGLCASCLADWVSTTNEGKEFLKSVRIIGAKKIKTSEKKEVKNISEYKKDLQTEVNKIARLIDAEKGCTSCDHGHNNDFTRRKNGGHKKSVGSNPTLRFNLDNIHLQCYICNAFLGGNEHQYHKGLIKRYGKEYADYVESLPGLYKTINLTKDDLIEAIKTARFIVREIEKGKDFTRKEVNTMLNIYAQS